MKDKKNKQIYQEITTNLSATVRHAKLDGWDCLVVPMVMIKEGVHNGSQGPLYYPPEELKKSAALWNHKPIIVRHSELDGKPVSACNADILNRQKVGLILNTHYEGDKLKAEAWLYEARLKEVNEDVHASVTNGKTVEISTGLGTDKEVGDGEWKGEAYWATVRNCVPDHLAILPDEEGACSIKDGAGLLANSKNMDKVLHAIISKRDAARQEKDIVHNRNPSAEEIRDLAETKLSKGATEAVIVIEATYSNFVIYRKMLFNTDGAADTIFKRSFEINDEGEIQFTEDPVEVRKEAIYRAKDGTVVNKQHTGGDMSTNKAKENPVKKIADQLISNEKVGWTEEDRKFLEGLDEATLNKIEPVIENTANASDSGQAMGEGGEPSTQTQTQTQNQSATGNAGGEGDSDVADGVEQFIANAPGQIQSVLRHGLKKYEDERKALGEKIIANKGNKFTKEDLEKMELSQLENIAALAEAGRQADFSGKGDGGPVANQEVEDDDGDPLDSPVMNFEKVS